MKRTAENGVRFFVTVLAAGLLTGCGGSFPDMTDTQYNQVVEYAAGLLLKYSDNGVKKLTYLEPTQPVEGVDEIPVQADLPTSIPDVAMLPEGEEEEDTDLLEGLTQEWPEGLPEEEEEDLPEGEQVSIAQGEKQTLENGLTLSYNGYSVYNYYPLEVSDVIISAELGNKLLVLSFTLENPGTEPVFLDMVTENPYFKIGINNVQLERYRPTILEDDLSTLVTEIAPGEKVNACLVAEVSDATTEQIRSLSLYARLFGLTQTATLE